MSRSTIAVLGASANRSKFGNKCVRAYLDAGWRVLPVNPKVDSVEGLDAFDALSDIDEPLDRISVYLPPAVTESLLSDIAARGAGEVWFNPGSANDTIIQQAREAGIEAINGCSIVDIGTSPGRYPG